jgi:hypothetical protein
MLLRKVMISIVVALLVGRLGAAASFDFENYTRYADSAEAAVQRFAAEPVFPIFILLANFVGMSVDMAIQALMTLGAALSVFAVINMANHGRAWSYHRAFSAIAVGLPFLIFGIIVPRQGLAMGLVLVAMSRAQSIRRLVDVRTFLLIFVALLTHGVTAAFGAILLVVGYAQGRGLFMCAIFFALLGLISLPFVDFNVGSLSPVAYQQYLGNFRDTGKYRVAAFVMVVALYGLFASRRHGGALGITAGRNLFVAQFFAVVCLLLYAFVGTDSVRFTYLLSLPMIADAVRRVEW